MQVKLLTALIIGSCLKNGLTKLKCAFITLRIFSFWHYHQEMYVRWSNTCSPSFRVSNGVKQGGIPSPILFYKYMDKLGAMLTESCIGGDSERDILNNL